MDQYHGHDHHDCHQHCQYRVFDPPSHRSMYVKYEYAYCHKITILGHTDHHRRPDLVATDLHTLDLKRPQQVWFDSTTQSSTQPRRVIWHWQLRHITLEFISAVTSDGSTVSPVTAIQIKVYSDKRGRLLDKTIKLTVDGVAVGNNLASSSAGNVHTYTAAVPTDLTVSGISTLGVHTQYKSGTQPHEDTMTVDTVQLLITYSTD